jgi:hypothetical protein
MDARLLRCAVLAAALGSLGASYRTKNFVVSAPTPEMARQIGDTAEAFRRDLAQDWLGQPMPNWSQPCPITAQVAENLGAGGATSFVFDRGEVFGWRMTIQGSLERILDSVLPHEVTHTIFATHFRQPLPRWADEGACTTVEHTSERSKQQHMLVSFLRTGRGISFSQMFAMKEYPHDVLPLYSQGYSVARWLVQQGGRQKFLAFLADGLQDENWTRATKAHYGYENLAVLQDRWLDWVRKGSPNIDVTQPAPAMVAVNEPRPTSPQPGPTELASASSSSGEQLSVYERAATSPEVLHQADPGSQKWHAQGESDSTASATAKAPDNQLAQVDSPPAAYQATRPQPVERPRQVILEWSRSNAGSGNPFVQPGGGMHAGN